MLMSWFGERTLERVTDEFARAGVRREHKGPRGRDGRAIGSRGINTPSDTRTARARDPNTTNVLPMDARRWYAHAMGVTDSMYSPPTAATHAGASMRKMVGLMHRPADTRAWADDTTNAIWGRGRRKEVDVTPRSIGALQVNIEIGDPLSSTFYQQQREQEELLLAQYTQGLRRRRQPKT
jgi:hypothetical protein